MKAICGFTLLEILVALGIFAIMAVIAHGGLRMVLEVRAQTDQSAQQLAQIQTAFMYLERDIEQLVNRPIRDGYGDIQPFLQGSSTQLEFTRMGWRNPTHQVRSTLQRVGYHVENHVLWRVYWHVLDRAQDSSPMPVALLHEVTEVQIRFLDDVLQWHSTWPPRNNEVSAIPNQATPHVRAIEIGLTVASWGKLIRLFRVVDEGIALLGAPQPASKPAL